MEVNAHAASPWQSRQFQKTVFRNSDCGENSHQFFDKWPTSATVTALRGTINECRGHGNF
jgi:hypothetical protein